MMLFLTVTVESTGGVAKYICAFELRCMSPSCLWSSHLILCCCMILKPRGVLKKGRLYAYEWEMTAVAVTCLKSGLKTFHPVD